VSLKLLVLEVPVFAGLAAAAEAFLLMRNCRRTLRLDEEADADAEPGTGLSDIVGQGETLPGNLSVLYSRILYCLQVLRS